MSTRLEAVLELQALALVDITRTRQHIADFEHSIEVMRKSASDTTDMLIEAARERNRLTDAESPPPKPNTPWFPGAMGTIMFVGALESFESNLIEYNRAKAILALVKRLSSPEPRML